MATLALGTLLKAGLAVVATGVSVATPILLSRGGNVSTLASDSSGGASQNSDSESYSESTTSSETVTSLGAEDLQRTRENSIPASQISQEASSTTTPAVSERFEKTCFEVPANYQGTEDIKLLTCFDAANSRNEDREENPPFDSEFHLHDKSQNNIPLKIEGNLFWEQEGKRITARMKKEGVSEKNEYIFTARGDGWNEVSSDSKIDVLDQCETYKVNSAGSVNFGKFWLSCADNTGNFDPNSPTAIPLTLWTSNQLPVS